jgi:light-regulated signal transduction histidine kinase (bacteriophytochrome)
LPGIRRVAGEAAAEVSWRSAAAGAPVIVARIDVASIDAGLVAYVARNGGLIALIVLTVTCGTMVVLHRTVLRDLLRLRASSNAAAQDPAHGADHALAVDRRDELGDLARSFNRLLRRVGARTAELELANRDLDSFGYSVSHDLRAPLGAIHGFSYLLRAQEAGRLSADGEHLLARIEDNAVRMMRMLEGLLEFSRFGRVRVAPAAVATAQLVEEVIAAIRGAPDAPEVEFRVRPLPDCRGDPVLLRQVWANLLGNAVKYSRHRDPAVVEIGFDAASRAYEVRDNGAGFDPSGAARLFGVFERLHSEAEFEGAGVGLAIARRIVERHGGRIWAEGAPGKGATLRFTLEA